MNVVRISKFLTFLIPFFIFSEVSKILQSFFDPFSIQYKTQKRTVQNHKRNSVSFTKTKVKSGYMNIYKKTNGKPVLICWEIQNHKDLILRGGSEW